MTNITQAQSLRPPAVPLITHDPYFSCWSAVDHLYDECPRHWTGKNFGLSGLIRVDGRTRRFMGAIPGIDAVEQISLKITATQSQYVFNCGPVELAVRFISPLLIDDLELLSRPASYIVCSVQSKDGRPHHVQLYFDASGEWAVNHPNQPVVWNRLDVADLNALSMRSASQRVLGSKGDDHRIDWGQFLVAAAADQSHVCMGEEAKVRRQFITSGTVLDHDDTQMPRPANQHCPVLSVAFDLGKVSARIAERRLILAYDDLYSIQYLGTDLPAWWRGAGERSSADLLKMAAAEYESVIARCVELDARIHDEALTAGGEQYAQLCDLLYRQSVSAHKLVRNTDGRPYFFSKENFSNGCIGTVDVTFPSAALYLAYNPALLAGMCDPVFEYCDRGRWTFPYAPHDLGTYPLANGQVYGGGEKTEDMQMPVEECGNMLILSAAICVREGSGAYARRHWKPLTQWKDYLVKNGLDPASQLCTDDFAGHLARNANLSIKAILGIASYAKMAEMNGEQDVAAENYAIARGYAQQWQKLADAGDHYVLAFGDPDTWSLKYNLVWGQVLDLKVFPPAVAQRELAHYLTRLQPYGLPMDSRKFYTKPEYICMIAAMAQKREDADRLVAGIHRYVNQTPSRVPMSDWYDTVTAKMMGMQARSVVGGCFIQVLNAKMHPAK